MKIAMATRTETAHVIAKIVMSVCWKYHDTNSFPPLSSPGAFNSK